MSVTSDRIFFEKFNEYQRRIAKLERQAQTSGAISARSTLTVTESVDTIDVTRTSLNIDGVIIQDTETITTVAAGAVADHWTKPTDQIAMTVIGNNNTGSFTSCVVDLEVSLTGSGAWESYKTWNLDTAGTALTDTVELNGYFTWDIDTDVVGRTIYYRYNVTAISLVGDGDIDITIYKVLTGVRKMTNYTDQDKNRKLSIHDTSDNELTMEQSNFMGAAKYHFSNETKIVDESSAYVAAVLADGQLKTTLYDAGGDAIHILDMQQDALGNTANGLVVTNVNMGFNGTTWDRLRSVNTGQLKTTLYDSSGNELGIQVAYSSIGATNTAIKTASLMHGSLTSTTSTPLKIDANLADGTSVTAINALQTVASLQGFNGTSMQLARLDKSTNSIQTIEYEHHEIHAGSHYEITQNENISVNNVYDIQITTPDTTKWSHLILKISCESETQVFLYENVTIDTAGTTIPAYNNNRNSGNVTGMTIKGISNASVALANVDTPVAGATEIKHYVVGAGKDAGEASRSNEIILKQNEDYCIRFVANSAGYVNFDLEWYEHTDKN